MNAAMTRIDDGRTAVARAQGLLGLAQEEFIKASNEAQQLQLRIDKALSILGPLAECLVEEQHPELADMAEAVDAALRGQAPVARVDRERAA